MEEKQTKSDQLLSSVTNALRILRSFTIEEPERGIRELAKSLSLSKSSVQRLMTTLAHEGFVTKDADTQKYRLGVSVLSLGTVVMNHLEIHREALPHLEKLVEKTEETAHIGILEGTKVVYLHKIETRQPIRIFTEIGKRNPSYCTGCGKAILAFQHEQLIEQVIEEGLHPYTSKTITDPHAFKQNLKEIRQNGYAVSVEELGEDIISVGAPIRDYMGNVFAGVSLVGPSYRMKQKGIATYAKEVMKVGLEISEKLGYRRR